MGKIVILEAKGMHYLLEVVNDWKKEYHTNKKGDIVFQNKKTMANVVLTDGAIHKISNHSRGFENIPETIQKPDEIWALWENPKKQTVVLRNYISFSPSGSYIVQTRDGIITDAFAVTNVGSNKYRKGVLLNL